MRVRERAHVRSIRRCLGHTRLLARVKERSNRPPVVPVVNAAL